MEASNKEKQMNGYTPSTSIETQLSNLAAQIPQEYRARVLAQAMSETGNPFDTQRALVGLVVSRIWETYEHPVDEAQRIEQEIDAELDGRTPEQDVHIKEYFGGVKVTTSAEWRRRHL